MYFTYAEQNQTFQSLGVWVSSNANVTGLAEPEQVRTILVSDGVLPALGISPVAGRWLSQADQIQGVANVACSATDIGSGAWEETVR